MKAQSDELSMEILSKQNAIHEAMKRANGAKRKKFVAAEATFAEERRCFEAEFAEANQSKGSLRVWAKRVKDTIAVLEQRCEDVLKIMDTEKGALVSGWLCEKSDIISERRDLDVTRDLLRAEQDALMAEKDSLQSFQKTQKKI